MKALISCFMIHETGLTGVMPENELAKQMRDICFLTWLLRCHTGFVGDPSPVLIRFCFISLGSLTMLSDFFVFLCVPLSCMCKHVVLL